jgi:MFS family permease
MDSEIKSSKPLFVGATAAIITASILPTVTITPILPKIQMHFVSVPQIDVLVQLIYALPALLSMLAAPFAGLMSDRIGRREIVLSSCLFATLFGIAPYFLESIWLIIASRALLGFFQGTLIVCTSALIADYFIKQRREKVLGLKFGFVGIANIILLIAVGYVSVTNWRNGFLLYLFGILATLLVFLFIKKPPYTQIASVGEKITIEWKQLIPPYFGAFMGAAAFTMLFSQLPYLLEVRGISRSPAFAGNLTSLTSAGMFIAAFFYAKLSGLVSAMRMWLFTFALVAIGFAILSTSSQLIGIAVGGFVTGLGAGLVMPNSLNMVLGMVPAVARGKAAGIQTTCWFLGIFAGPMIGVTLSRVFDGPSNALGVWSFVAVLTSILYLVINRSQTERH